MKYKNLFFIPIVPTLIYKLIHQHFSKFLEISDFETDARRFSDLRKFLRFLENLKFSKNHLSRGFGFFNLQKMKSGEFPQNFLFLTDFPKNSYFSYASYTKKDYSIDYVGILFSFENE